MTLMKVRDQAGLLCSSRLRRGWLAQQPEAKPRIAHIRFPKRCVSVEQSVLPATRLHSCITSEESAARSALCLLNLGGKDLVLGRA